ncbi:hypothetical protein C8R45DRAFT_945871 [Mycena sanguinolenta]|nr:hypothetical protein C8R45DRAFT_945871 [Mycena sanguinolenta]
MHISSEPYTRSPADPKFSSCTCMARDNPSGGFHATCPQELIDFILGQTDSADKETLKSCALVAHSFRPTSQKLIFSTLTILPPGCDSLAALQRLADVLSASPHLALHVRTLSLVQSRSYEPCVWMQSDILPAILSMFTNLKGLNVRIFDWHSISEQTRSPLSSIELNEARLQSKSLLSLLRCIPASLESASFSDELSSSYPRYGDDLRSTSAKVHKLRLASLHLDSHAPTLFWVIRAVDLKRLRRLHTMVKVHEMKVMGLLQKLLDGAVHVETYHLFIQSITFDRAC